MNDPVLEPEGLDLEVLAHDARGKVACVISIARMLADGLAGPVSPVQVEFCERMEGVGWDLEPLLRELVRRAGR